MKEEYQEKMRQKIIQTTLALLKEKGIEQFTIRSVATTLGISVGSIYTHFLDKETILKEIYAQTCRDFLKTLQACVYRHKTDEENYIELIVNACHFRIQNAYRYQHVYPSLKEDNPEPLKPVRTFMLTQLAKLKLPALSSADKLEKADRTVLALCEGISRMALGKKDFAWSDLILFSMQSIIKGWNLKPKKDNL